MARQKICAFEVMNLQVALHLVQQSIPVRKHASLYHPHFPSLSFVRRPNLRPNSRDAIMVLRSLRYPSLQSPKYRCRRRPVLRAHHHDARRDRLLALDAILYRAWTHRSRAFLQDRRQLRRRESSLWLPLYGRDGVRRRRRAGEEERELKVETQDRTEESQRNCEKARTPTAQN